VRQPVIESINNFIIPRRKGRGRPKKVSILIENNKSQQNLDEQQSLLSQYPYNDHDGPTKNKLTIENKDIARNCRYNLRSSNQMNG
jgi:hypothetical protein